MLNSSLIFDILVGKWVAHDDKELVNKLNRHRSLLTN